ncbi:MAG TPA: beta-ketoacyl-[acyl-carrier-protein] synthase family protein [Abditibacteriaceae bacterium]|jgi:3-oxoacyl-(acyl-carrier-protein) synthase
MNRAANFHYHNPRVAVTGWYLGWLHDGSWLEWNAAGAASTNNLDVSLSADFLRRSCDGGRLLPTRDATEEWQRLLRVNGSQFHAATARACAEVARVGLTDKNGLLLAPERVAVSFSSSKGELARWHSNDLHRDNAFLAWTPDAAARAVSTRIGAMGATFAPVAACATGAHSLSVGAQHIQDGYADVVVAGAIEAGLTPLVMAGYAQLGALSKSGVMRPFDRRRDGFVPREGIALLVLESETSARARGAQVLGWLSGWSMHADATSMTAMSPAGDTIARAIEVALRRASCPQIDYINVHGTATSLNDVVESRAIKSVFGNSVASSSTKALSGHWLGAAGALEAVLCLQSMREGFLPPTLNLEEPDDECDLDYVPNIGRDANINCALSLSYGFGGHIGALVLEKGDG